VKRVTERRCDDLRKCGAERTRRIGEAGAGTGFAGADVAGADVAGADVAGADLGEMADLVNNGALLRNQQQQQEAERFEHLSHSNSSDEVR
jgi:uncharacterized protein YjbI with pentapeptide repeats